MHRRDRALARTAFLVAFAPAVAAPARADSPASQPSQPSQPDEPDPNEIAGVPPTGKAASIEAACQLEPVDKNQDEMGCLITKAKGKAKVPYKGFRVVTRENSYYGAGYLAIQLDDGWYLAQLGIWSTDGADHGDVTVKSVQVKDVVPGGDPELVVTGHRSDERESHEYETFGTTAEMLWVCGRGASGAPSCAAIEIGRTYVPHPDIGDGKWKVKARYKFDKTGAVIRTLSGKWPTKPDWMEEEPITRDALVNSRTLRFP